MSLSTRTALASIMRQYHQGFISRADVYHAICNLYANDRG